MSKSYSVFEYNKNTLCSYISNITGSQYALLFQKKQFIYLDNYLNHFLENKEAVISVVCEHSYIDKGFIDDYVSFYSRCYNNYGKVCSRIHFFLHEFQCTKNDEYKNANPNEKEKIKKHEKEEKCISSDESLQNALLGKKDKTVISQENYLGFLVIRPIPITFIAKLCLKPYKEDIHNLLDREYKVSLFGIDLAINTIAFQEQDRVVSACATSALWSMYHAHIDFPLKYIPSASAITKSAIEKSGADMAEGLNPEKIVQQIESNGLKPILLNLEDDKTFIVLKETIKVLIDSKLPLILGVDVNDSNGKEAKGKHALTVLGYEEKNSKISSIFVHDDRYGPYARMDFVDKGLKISLRKADGTDDESEIYTPLMLIYACYPKVHIPYTFLRDTRKSLITGITSYYKDNKILKETQNFLLGTNEIVENELQWNIRLCKLNDLRNQLKDITPINDRINALTTNYPKYIWNLTASYEEFEVYFLFDATDIVQGNSFISILYNSENTKELFDDYFMKYFQDYAFFQTAKEPLFELPENAIWEMAQRTHYKEKYYDFLDTKYGIYHFPNIIKNEEVSDSDLRNTIEYRTVINESTEFKLDSQLFTQKEQKYIWVIDKEGYFCIAVETTQNVGHPTLTNGEPGRIGGEIYCEGGIWKINPFSGRYSKEYSPDEKNEYIKNVIEYRLTKIFPGISFTQIKA